MSSALYRSCPIDPSNGEIRLLEIISSPDDTIIKCAFHTALLSTQPKFIALSYTWETAAESVLDENRTSQDHIIVVNDHELKIKENLFQFLHHARNHKERYERVWINAVCIDQNSNGEKSSAVSNMGQVYSAATSVVAWLGMATPETDEIFEYAKSNRITRLYKVLHHEDTQTAEQKVGCFYVCEPDYHEDLRALQRFIAVLFGHRYWTRYWIVQEIFLSGRLHIVCGEQQITWSQCAEALSYFQKAVEEGVIAPSAQADSEAAFTQSLMRSKGYYLSRGFEKPLSLCKALLLFFHKGCKDPRDRIFALQSIIRKEDQTQVDYEQSCEDVYVNAAHTLARSAIRDVTEKVAAAEGDHLKILQTASQLHHDAELLRKLFVEFIHINARLSTDSVDGDKVTTWKIRFGLLLWQIDKAGAKVRETGIYHDPLDQIPEAGERVYWLEMTQNSGVLEWGTQDKPCRLGPDGSYSGTVEEFEGEMGRLTTMLGKSGDVASYIPDRNKPWYHEKGEDSKL